MAVKKLGGGLEDLLFGMSTKVQIRNSREITVTEINADHIPYNKTQSIKDALDLGFSTVEGAYLLNGTQEITAPFAGGGQVFTNASKALVDTDLTTLGQVEAKLEIGVYNRPSRSLHNKRNKNGN